MPTSVVTYRAEIQVEVEGYYTATQLDYLAERLIQQSSIRDGGIEKVSVAVRLYPDGEETIVHGAIRTQVDHGIAEVERGVTLDDLAQAPALQGLSAR